MAKVPYVFILLAFITSAFANEPSGFGQRFSDNVGSELREQINSDLKFLSEIRGSDATPLHTHVFGTVEGKEYARFLNQRISSFDLSDDGPDNAAAYVDLKFPKVMKFKSLYLTSGMPQILRVSVILHEARHTEIENHGWPHEVCPLRFMDRSGQEITALSGEKYALHLACDSDEMGAYGIQIIMLKNVARFCTSCTEKVKMDAEFAANQLMMRMISDPAQENLIRDLYDGSSKNLRLADTRFVGRWLFDSE